MPSHIISHEDFKPHAGSRFSLVDADIPMAALDLVDVTPLTGLSFPNSTRIPFSLLFKSLDQRVLPQRLYRLSHGSMGELDIFLVPIAQDESGITYEAAFN